MSILRFFLLISCAVSASVNAQPETTARSAKNTTLKVPAFLQSEQIEYDDANQVVTALGNVFVAQDSQLLHADKVQYFKLQDKIVATGHVWLRDSEGNYSFANNLILSNKMADGFVENVKILMVDQSRLAGNLAKRYEGKRVVLWQGVYSPCEVCKAEPEKAPLWQLKADKIIHNQEIKMIQYHHAWMEFFGWPIFYVPYFSHPDPAVKRKTGFLMPIYSHSNDLGYSVTVPYFIASAQNHDFTLFPTFTSKQGVIPAFEHRYHFDNGEYVMHGSYANNTTTGFASNYNPNNYGRAGHHRWHYFMRARYDITPELLFTLDVQRASDLTYLKRFPVLPRGSVDPFASSTALTTTAALERFRPESYGVIRSYVFQADRQKTVPVVLPIIQYAHETLPGSYGETWMADFNFLNLYRDKAIIGRSAESMVRGSLGLGGQVPYVSPWGDVWSLKAYMRGDLYYINGYEVKSNQKLKDKTQGRYYPQASLTWRYPFLSINPLMHWILEPAAMLTTSSVGGNFIEIPNEDSPVVIVDTTNIFLANRLYGIDRIDSGHRFVYGFNSQQLFTDSRKFNLFLGQSVRIDKNQVLPLRSGEDRKASNFVSGIQIVPVKWLDIRSRAMFNRRTWRVDVAESSATIKSAWLNGSLGHTFYNKNFAIDNKRISQLVWGVSSGQYRGFSLSYSEIRNLYSRQSVRILNRSISLRHTNECLVTTFSVVRTGFRDRDLRPDTKILLQLDFKNLGTIYPVNISNIGGLRRAPVPQTVNGPQSGGQLN